MTLLSGPGSGVCFPFRKPGAPILGEVESAAATAHDRPAGRRAAGIAFFALPLVAWSALIVAGWAWGNALIESTGGIGLGAPPLFGAWELRLDPAVLLPAGFAALAVVFMPPLATSLSWPRLLLFGAAGALGWSLALALTAGPSGVLDPLESPFEYLAGVPFVSSPGDYLQSFTDRLGTYPVHVQSHPPGLVMALWGLEQIGLGGSGPASALVIVAGASAVPAVLITARSVAGEEAARRAAPFLVLAPAAVWIATSADALFMGAGAWAVAASVLSTGATGTRSRWLAAAGGALFGLCALLSYGLVLLAVIPLALAAMRRRIVPLAITAACAAGVILIPLVAGFWWFDGYLAVREEYLASVAKDRPYDYFLVNNLAAFAIATGPVVALALARVRLRVAWALPLAALAAVALADLSGMSKGEVERIWLPFLPWVMLATAALPWTRRGQIAGLLVLQAAVGIAVQVGVRTPW